MRIKSLNKRSIIRRRLFNKESFIAYGDQYKYTVRFKIGDMFNVFVNDSYIDMENTAKIDNRTIMLIGIDIHSGDIVRIVY